MPQSQNNGILRILFGVEGDSAIDKGSGKRIVQNLTDIIDTINSRDDVIPKILLKFDTGQATANLRQQLAGITQQQDENKALAEGNKLMRRKMALEKAILREQSRHKNIKPDKKHGGYFATVGAGEYATNLVAEYRRVRDTLAGAKYQNIGLEDPFSNGQRAVETARYQRNAAESWSKLSAKVNEYIQRVEYAASRDAEAARGLKDMADIANSGDINRYDELNEKLAEVRGYINQNALATETWGQKVRKAFGDILRTTLAGAAGALLTKTVRELYNDVDELDKAVVNLQIASGKSRTEVQALVKSYSELARTLGATTAEVAESADAWLRQGYSLEETNDLIKNGMMLSKLGQIDAATATTNLTSAMKGYKVAAEDSLSIVDKLTAVDMAAAASAGGMATAMAETAAGASLAGVSMDKLLGYIATVKEVTQDADESVGTFFRTIFARMGNIKAGKFIDGDSGESLSDVESVLENVGVKLRISETEFRNFGDVLDDVAARWSTFQDTQQHAVATALAGTRQQEKFIVLMSNYAEASKYAKIAADSSGTATEKWTAYMDGAEAKTNAVTAALEKLSQALIKSDWIGWARSGLAGIISGLAEVTDLLGNIPGLAGVALTAISKSAKVTKKLDKLLHPAKLTEESFYGKDVLNNITRDQAAIKRLVVGLRVSPDTGRVWERFWQSSSGNAHDFIHQLDSVKSVASLTNKELLETARKYKDEVFTAQWEDKVGGSLSNVATVLKLYKNGTAAAGITTDQLRQAIAKANPELDQYLTKVEAQGGTPTMWGYIRQTKQSILQTIGLTTALTALQMFANGMVRTAKDGATGGARFASVLTTVAGAVTAVTAAVLALKSVIQVGTGVEFVVAGISAVIAGIRAWTATSDKVRASWQADIEKIDELKQSSDELADAYINVQKYLTALQNGESVGDDLDNAITELNKTLGDNKIQFDNASMSAEEYANRIQEATKESLKKQRNEALISSVSAEKSLLDATGTKRENTKLGITVSDYQSVQNILGDMPGIAQEWESMNALFASANKMVLSPQLYDAKDNEQRATRLIDYYKLLSDAQLKLAEAEDSNGVSWKQSRVYDDITAEIGIMKDAVEDLINARYQEAKLNYEIANGIPTTKAEYDSFLASLEKTADAFGSQYLKTEFLSQAYDEFADKIKGLNSEITNVTGSLIIKKSALDILDAVQEGYDGISEALQDMAEGGSLTASSLTTLYQLQKENKLAGLDLSKVITRTADGYTLASNALDEYIAKLISLYTNNMVLASATDRENALANLLELRAVLMTLQSTQRSEASKKATKAQTDALEAQKDALDDELDAYKKLIELRKKLLKSYEDERSYNKDLEKKQKNLAKLQTQLALSKLDTSAAGQARTRELAEQVDEAQDDLNDFTLEHAIEKITNDLDAQYSEYEQFIDGKISEIEEAIKALDTTSDVNIDLSGLDAAMKQIDSTIQYIQNLMQAGKESVSDIEGNASKLPLIKGDTSQLPQAMSENTGIISGGMDRIKTKLSTLESINTKLDTISSRINTKASSDVVFDSNVKPGLPPLPSGNSAAKGTIKTPIDASIVSALITLPKAEFNSNAKLRDQYGTYVDYLAKYGTGTSSSTTTDAYAALLEEMAKKKKSSGARASYIPLYHSGGIVGGTELGANEEFAKLLKGEFVATPAQIQKFMGETLPMMVSRSGEKNEFNAPLIEVHCDNVTSEALPKLQSIVNDAVKIIQKELDSGMSRNGYKGTVKKRLT